MKYSTFDGVVAYGDALSMAVSAGDSFDDDHALVVERPDLFTDEVPGAKHAGPGYRGADVETASTTPGGRRVRGRS